MGASCSNPAQQNTLEIKEMAAQYKDKRLPQPELSSYKSDFEREFFMVVNLLRDNPLSFQNYVKNYVAKGKFKGDPNTANTLINRFKSLEKLEAIQLNAKASNSCYINLTKNESTPAQVTGGALNELTLVDANLVAQHKCYDTCKKKWVGSALECVLSFLLSYYERQPETAHHAFLDPTLLEIGCAELKSRSQGTFFQVLFIE